MLHTMNHQDQMMLMSQLFPSSAYTEVIPQQGNSLVNFFLFIIKILL
jgi:hypothetical protein